MSKGFIRGGSHERNAKNDDEGVQVIIYRMIDQAATDPVARYNPSFGAGISGATAQTQGDLLVGMVIKHL